MRRSGEAQKRYYAELAEIALGWLGWTEKQTLAADPNAILVGYEGRVGMLEAMGLVKRTRPSKKRPGRSSAAGKPPKLTPKAFDFMFTFAMARSRSKAKPKPKETGKP